MVKYGGLSIYDIVFEKIYSIDDKEVHFVNGYGYALIGNPDHTDGTSTDREYFVIHDHLFGRISETEMNPDIALKVIHKYFSLPSMNENSKYSIYKLRSGSEIFYVVINSRGKYRKHFMTIH